MQSHFGSKQVVIQQDAVLIWVKFVDYSSCILFSNYRLFVNGFQVLLNIETLAFCDKSNHLDFMKRRNDAYMKLYGLSVDPLKTVWKEDIAIEVWGCFDLRSCVFTC